MGHDTEVCLIGLGEFGMTLGQELSRLGVSTLGIDRDHDIIQKTKDILTAVYQLDATDKKALEQIGIQEMTKAVVNTGDNLENGLMICINLIDLGIQNIWVVANTSDQERVYRRIGVQHIIFPERDVAVQVANHIYNPDFVAFLPFGRKISLREIVVQKAAGRTLLELALPQNNQILVVGLKRAGERSFTFIPDPKIPLNNGDKVIALGQAANFENLAL